MRTGVSGGVSPSLTGLLCLVMSDAHVTQHIAVAQAGGSPKALRKVARKKRTAQGHGTPGGRALGGLAGVDPEAAGPKEALRAAPHWQTELRREAPMLKQEVGAFPSRPSREPQPIFSILAIFDLTYHLRQRCYGKLAATTSHDAAQEISFGDWGVGQCAAYLHCNTNTGTRCFPVRSLKRLCMGAQGWLIQKGRGQASTVERVAPAWQGRCEMCACLQRRRTTRTACHSAPAGAEGGAAPEGAPGTGAPRTVLPRKQVRGTIQPSRSLGVPALKHAAHTLVHQDFGCWGLVGQ